MFTLFEPSDAQIEEFLASQKDLPFSYPRVGASQTAAIPAGYPVNHHRVHLGDGADAFARAKDAIQSWTMYKLSWTRLYPPNAPVAGGEVVCAVVNHGFCWTINPCRIIYLLEKSEKNRETFGFGFGTLPGHSEAGEERFTVERRADDAVWFEIWSFARPHDIVAKIGFPLVGFFQRKFAKDSGRAMFKAVSENK